MYSQYKEAAKQRKVRSRISTLKKRSSWMRLTGAHGADEEEEDRDAYDKGADAAAGDVLQTLEGATRLKKRETAAAAGWYARGGFKDLDVGDDLLDGLDVDSGAESSSDLSEEADGDRIMREDDEGRQDWADRMEFKRKRREERAKIVAKEEKKAEKKKGALALVTVPQTELGDIRERLNSAVVRKTTPGRGPAAIKETEEVEQRTGDDDEALDSDTLSDSADSTDDASDLSEERARVFAAAHSAVNKKRKRSELRDVAFSRYAYADDVKSLPSWFIDDEASRLKDPLQVTEDEVKAAREFYNRNLVRGTVNKAAEAAFRKKRKISRRLAQLKEKASDLAVDETADRAEKAVEMESLLKNARRLTKTNTSKREKKYIVSKRGGGGHVADQSGGGGNHKIVAVDKRLKADKRARKTRNKKSKKGKRR
jgi:hypothetical protein